MIRGMVGSRPTRPLHEGEKGIEASADREMAVELLLIFGGNMVPLITAILCPGTCHPSRSAVAFPECLVRYLHALWPHVTIDVRADSGFAVPAPYASCEARRIPYTTGLICNDRLAAMAAHSNLAGIRSIPANGRRRTPVRRRPTPNTYCDRRVHPSCMMRSVTDCGGTGPC
jgi:hypothetical protein